MIRSYRERKQKERDDAEMRRRQEQEVAAIREERSMRTRNDLWAMAEHIRNMVIDLRSWIYWLGYDRSQIPEENIDRAYDDIKAEIRRFLEQDGLRAIVRKTAEELIYELDDHMHIFKGMGTMDRDSEVALRKSTNRLIDLENSMRSEFHNGKFEGDEIG